MREEEAPRQGLRRILKADLGVQVALRSPLPSLEHAYTHYRVQLQAFLGSIRTGMPHSSLLHELTWAAPEELAGFPMGKLDRSISDHLSAGEAP